MKTQTSKNRRRTLAAGALLALTVGAIGVASTASNTVPTSKAGDGSGTISGYVASSVHYTLNTDPSKIDSVSFNLDTAPVAGSTIKAQVVNGGTWYSCTNSGVAVTCTTGDNPTVLSADQLRIIVAQ